MHLEAVTDSIREQMGRSALVPAAPACLQTDSLVYQLFYHFIQAECQARNIQCSFWVQGQLVVAALFSD
jgi:hypothetical protein